MAGAIRMGQLPRSWNPAAKSITFCVTEDCNLACKYCYMTGKNAKHTMPFEVARKAVDYILTHREHFKEEAVVWEFIGGEPFLETDLIDRICDYIKQQMFLLDHPWFDAYRFNFSTNGLLYHTPKVQKFIWKNHGHTSIGISIDGNKAKHDLQRVRKDGSGSFDAVRKNVPLWLSQMPNTATKSTFSHDDLPHLKDSVVALWAMGIKAVAANLVFEDVWAEGDEDIFEAQLKALADYVIENRLYDEYSVRFFDPQVGNPLTEDDLNVNYCGVGKMLAIDCQGNFYPCIRFYDISLSNRKGLRVGDIHTGINTDRLRPFHALTLRGQSPDECIGCQVGKGCAWCSGCNYDCAETDTIFQRATFICKMHKANARANEYFWARYSETTGRVSEKEKLRSASPRGGGNSPRFLLLMTRDDITPHCNYRNTRGFRGRMDEAVRKQALAFCTKEGFTPVLLGTPDARDTPPDALFIIEAGETAAPPRSIALYDNHSAGRLAVGNCILLVDRARLAMLHEFVHDLAARHGRVNVILEDIDRWGDAELTLYENQLGKIIETTRSSYTAGSPVEVNVLTDLWALTGMENCGAGENTFAVAPDGRIYFCPAFYYHDPDDFVGTLDSGIRVKNPRLLKADHSPYCGACDVFSCRRCKFLNKSLTGEIGIPSRIQCRVSHLERKMSMTLQGMLLADGSVSPPNLLRPIAYDDPLELLASTDTMRGVRT
jgi:radical SAM peptide maturase (CXXX-repeat target family)/CXXX repeat peptide maturase